MTIVYICPGCRLNALRRFRFFLRICPASRATFLSLNSTKPAALRGEEAARPPIANVSHDDPPPTAWPYDGRIEADIIPDIDVNGKPTDRLLDLMRSLVKDRPLRTRYSQTVVSRPVPASRSARKSISQHGKVDEEDQYSRKGNRHSGNGIPTRLASAPKPVLQPSNHPIAGQERDDQEVEALPKQDQYLGIEYSQDPGEIASTNNGSIRQEDSGPRGKERDQEYFEALKTPAGEPPPPEMATPAKIAHAVELDRLLQRKGKLYEAWTYFRRYYSHPGRVAIISPALQDVPLLRQGRPFVNLLIQTTNMWIKRHLRNQMAYQTPTGTVVRLHDLGLMHDPGLCWGLALWCMIVAIQHNAMSAGPRSNDELVTELMNLWKSLFEKLGRRKSADVSTPSSEPPNSWPWLPSGDAVVDEFLLLTTRVHETGNKSFTSWLMSHLPRYSSTASWRLSRAAVATYTILVQQHQRLGISKPVLQDAMPFAVFVARILYLTNSRSHYHQVIEQDLLDSRVPEAQVASFMGCVEAGERNALFVCFTRGASVSLDTGTISPNELVAIEKFFVTRIKLCANANDLLEVKSFWRKATTVAESPTLRNLGLKFSGELYDQFIFSYMRLGQPTLAVIVWNALNAQGYKPTVKTWTSMMDGFRAAGQFDATEQLWTRMLASGTKADVYAWSTRIQALFQGHGVEDGMLALRHFGDIWNDTVRKAGSEQDAEQLATRPTAYFLNRVISVFNKTGARNTQIISGLLVWGKSHGIKPDIVTMNILLTKSLNGQDPEEAARLFRVMQQQGLKPDSATYAIIMDSLFRADSVVKAGFEARMNSIGAVLQELESQDLEVASHTYTSLINGLVKNYGNIDAARAVLNFMVSRNAKPHIHIFTILATHLFQQKPPDVVGLDILWLQLIKFARPDVVFYDRMIEGYAAIGDIGKAMSFLSKMSKHNLRPGWRALTAIVQALAYVGDWSRLDSVLNDVQGELHEGNRFDEEQFWETVASVQASRPSPQAGVPTNESAPADSASALAALEHYVKTT